MPSLAQCQELIDNTTYTWTTQNGVNGGKFTGPNGGTIFVPAEGYRGGAAGSYWSSTLDERFPSHTYYLDFGRGYASWYGGYRHGGVTVRPVR